jgi:hypothetical protein
MLRTTKFIDLLNRQESIIEQRTSLAAHQRPLIDLQRPSDLLMVFARGWLLVDVFGTAGGFVERHAGNIQRHQKALSSQSVARRLDRIARRVIALLATDNRGRHLSRGGAR